MTKTLGVVIGGIFVGAVGMEILRRSFPSALDDLHSKIRDAASGARDAFRQGYENATGQDGATEPTP